VNQVMIEYYLGAQPKLFRESKASSIHTIANQISLTPSAPS
jgi:hypothetical protein